MFCLAALKLTNCLFKRFRHAAIRSLGGIRRIPLNLTQAETETNSNQETPFTAPRFANVVSMLATTRKLNSNSNAIQGDQLSYHNKSYANILTCKEKDAKSMLRLTDRLWCVPKCTSQKIFKYSSLE